jgi:N-methylhydantoinase A
VANAYVLPLMASYLARMQDGLRGLGSRAPLLLMMSSGGVCTVETACRFPIRLVESGPAGGVVLAQHVAARGGYDKALSFDMGGTTAKITLIDDFMPQQSRHFEVARAYRFAKGSGIPVRIPVIDMVEIGAGGGSIARVDVLRRIAVGPDSAGSDPGPSCYARGGSAPTVTDADVVLGRIDPARFASGKIALNASLAERAVADGIGAPLGLPVTEAARGIAEIVDERMASAARVHAVENGKDTAARTLIAFGGAAPLHAARLAQKLGISRVVIPPDAGVGSAFGFLAAPVAYEVARTLLLRLHAIDQATIDRLFTDMRVEAAAVVRLGVPSGELVETRTAFMRYRGQGHEIAVPLGDGALDPTSLRVAFDATYTQLFGRIIPGLEVEAVTWTLALSQPFNLPAPDPTPAEGQLPAGAGRGRIVDPVTGRIDHATVFQREQLTPGMRLAGPAVITEAGTSTIVPSGWTLRVDAAATLVMVADSAAR